MSGYGNFITSLGELMAGVPVVDATSATPFQDDDANAILPAIIADAEGMMYRDPDLDFMLQRTTISGTSTNAGVRTLPIPSQLLVAEQVALYTPAGSPAESGTRVNLSRVDLSWINAVYSDTGYTAAPVYGTAYYAIFDGLNIVIAPTPDDSYAAEFYGLVTQAPLSATNPDTILTTYYPDVFLAAACILMSAYQKNFSEISDGPQQGISWQTHYNDLKKGAAFQSARSKFLGAGATAFPPAQVVQTTR